MSQTPSTLDAGVPLFVGLRQDRERRREGMPSKSPGCVTNNFTLSVDRKRRNRVRLLSRLREGIGSGQSGNSQLIFGLFVVGFQIVVGDRPIFEGSAGDASVGRLHPKVFAFKAPRRRPISKCGPTDGCCSLAVRVVDSGIDKPRSFAIRVSKRAGVGVDGGTVCWPKGGLRIQFAVIEMDEGFDFSPF